MCIAEWLSRAAEYRVLSPGKSTSFNKGFYKYAKLKIFRIWYLHIPHKGGICVSLFTCCTCKFMDMSLHCVATSLVWLILNIREFFTPGRVDEGGEELLNDLQCIPTCHRGREVA